MKTIAIIESCDTKYKEAAFMKDFIEAAGLHALVINTATGPVATYDPADEAGVVDINRDEIASAYGTPWEELEDKTKGEKVAFMCEAVCDYVYQLYKAGRIDGIVSIGGVQNTSMAVQAMQVLPIGFPKVMATTVASGTKQFQLVVGDKDIVAMPTVCDCTGINIITERILANACSCCIGMVEHAGQVIRRGDKPVIGLTLMGVTNSGCMAAVETLEAAGYEVLGFHATGVGGSVMEQMAAEGLIDACLDLTLHEINAEYFLRRYHNGGFSYGPGAAVRLLKASGAHVPLVVSLGGIDFVDYSKTDSEILPDRASRKTYDHNAELVHIKINREEAKDLGQIVAERLNKSDYPIKLLIPTQGMRHNTLPGEALCDPGVDKVLIDTIRDNIHPNIELIELEGNLDTPEWGKKAAEIMLDVCREAGIVPR